MWDVPCGLGYTMGGHVVVVLGVTVEVLFGPYLFDVRVLLSPTTIAERYQELMKIGVRVSHFPHAFRNHNE